MDAILQALLNTGGMGAVAAVVLWLHRDALKIFRSELAEERKLHARNVLYERETAERRHAEQMDAHKETRHAVRGLHQDVSLKFARLAGPGGPAEPHKPKLAVFDPDPEE